MEEKKTTVLNLTDEEFVHPGNRACAGCGLNILYRIGLKAIGRDAILVVPPSCLTVMQGLYPIASTQLSVLNVTFASTAAAASGVKAALRAQKNDHTQVVAWAGDGGTSDIGIQALSGAIERGEDFLYICYDNEGYMNTGVQRSGTTPQGALTANTSINGKRERSKDVPGIVAAHSPAYVATCSAAYPMDFYDKIKKALSLKGLKYIHAHTPCPPGWGMEERVAVAIGRLAVNTGLYVLYEIEGGEMKLSEPSAKLLKKKTLPPVSEYLETQGRFKALAKEAVEKLQQEVDAKWAAYRRQMT
ncbi:MAG: thiamine pyrophosphate-dependent enzyme [Candidatus Binatia bacterium]